MPIIHMARTLDQVPEGAANVRDVSDDWRSSVAEQHRADFTLYLYDTHVGLCLQDGERNGYDDSDFYMVVWNPDKGAPETITFASTRGWSYPCYGSSPDATPEVQAAYEAWKTEAQRQARIRRDIEQSKVVDYYRTVCVVRGRKVPLGTEGEVFWMGRGRVGIRLVDGSRVFTAVSNVEVVNPDQYREVAS